MNPSFLFPLSKFLYAGNNHLVHYLGEPLWWHPYSDLRAVYSDQKPHTPAPPFPRLPGGLANYLEDGPKYQSCQEVGLTFGNEFGLTPERAAQIRKIGRASCRERV